MSEELFEENPRYAPDGYWPIGTPPPRRSTEGRSAVVEIRDMIVSVFPETPTLEEVQAHPKFAEVHRSDIIDALSMITEGVIF